MDRINENLKEYKNHSEGERERKQGENEKPENPMSMRETETY